MKELSTTEIEQLEALWKGNLKDPEKTELETRLGADAEFREAAENLRQTARYLDFMYREKLREHLKSLPIDKQAPADAGIFVRYKKLLLRAAVLIGILIIGIKLGSGYFSKSPDPIALNPVVQKHLVAPIWTRSISGTVRVEEQISEAARAYNRRDYADAARLFEQAARNRPGERDLIFFSGVSALLSNDPDHAIRQLTTLLPDQGDGRISWYIALAYLQKGNQAEALKITNELREKGLAFSQKAQDLWAELSGK